MISYDYVEDYLEVIAGKRDIATKTITGFAGSLFASFSFAPIINLARYDNNFLDNVTDTTLAGGALTDRQADLGVKLINKYQRQLTVKGISIDSIGVPKYRKPLRIISRARTAEVVDGMIHLIFPYDAPMIEQVRNISKTSQGSIKFDRDARLWRIGLTEYNINWVCEFGKALNFVMSDELQGYMQDIVLCEQQGYALQLSIVDNQLVIENASQSMIDYVNNHLGGFDLDNLETLVDHAPVLGYEIDSTVTQALEQEYGGDVYLLMSNKEYDLNHAPDAVSRIVRYAELTNRWPIVAFNPTPEDTLVEWSKYFTPDQILVLGNQKEKHLEVLPSHKLIYTHRAIKSLSQIPILVSHAGMMVGTDKQIMLTRAEKIFYAGMKLKS